MRLVRWPHAGGKVFGENTERYHWEKFRLHASEAERRNNGGTEHGTLDFHAHYTQMGVDEDLAAEFEVEPGAPVLRPIYWTTPKTEAAPLRVSHPYLLPRHRRPLGRGRPRRLPRGDRTELIYTPQLERWTT